MSTKKAKGKLLSPSPISAYRDYVFWMNAWSATNSPASSLQVEILSSSLDASFGNAQNRISFEVIHARLRIHTLRGCVPVHSPSHGIHAGGSRPAVFRCPGTAAATMGPARASGRVRRPAHDRGLSLSVQLGSLRDVGLVCRNAGA